MPLHPLDSRSCIGNYHKKISSTIPDQKSQREIIRYLAGHPGDRLKKARAHLVLQSLLFITIAPYNTSSHALPSMAQKKERNSPIFPVSRLSAERQTENTDSQRHHWHSSLVLARSDAKAGNTSILPAIAQPRQIKSVGGNLLRHSVKPGSSTVARHGHEPAPLKSHAHAINKRSLAGVDDAYMDNNIKAQTRRITDWLIKKRLFVAGVVANHLYALINQCIQSLQEDPALLPTLARELSKPSGNFGAYREEILLERSQNRIYNQWLESIIFKPSVGEFIARALVITKAGGDENPSSRSAIAQIYSATEDMLAGPARADEDHASPIAGRELSRAAQRYIMDKVVFPAMPTLRFHNETESFTGMDIGSVEWVYLQAGLGFADSQELGGAQLSKDELFQLGHSLEEMLSAAVIDPEFLFLFDAPAKIFYSRQQITPVTERAVENIFHAPNASSIALEAFFAAGEKYKTDHNPVEILLSALNRYQTRTALSEDLTQATELFRQQNEDIAAKYTVVDDMLLLQTLGDLAPEESEFITSSKVALISAKFSAFHHLRHQMISRHLPRHSYSIGLLPEVDLLAASVGSDIRIFALRPTRSGYKLDRIDKITERYYELMTDPTTARKDPDYQLEVHANAVNAPVMKNAGDTFKPLIKNLLIRHKQRLIDQLHQAGFEETTWEKTQKILLSLIPLYDCISGIREERREAILSCLMDAFTLVPLAGRGMAITARFAQQGAMGGTMALRANLGAMAVRASFREVLRRTGTDLVRFAVVPAAQELNRQAMISLGLAAVRAIDPGFELAGIAGARAVKQLISVAKLMEGRLPVWQKVRIGLEQRQAHSIMTPHEIKVTTARLPGLDKDLPVVKLGGDKLSGQDIYVRFNPETGEAFGRKYTLTPEKVLQAVPAPLAKRLRTIFEQGLSGRGAPDAGKKFAGLPNRTPYSRITDAHLRAWVENGLSPHPTAMAAFIQQRGIPLNQWQHYVHPEGTLTARGRALLESHGPDSGNRILNLPAEVQQRISGQMRPRTLHDIEQAFRPTIIEHTGRASLRELAAVQRGIVKENLFGIWEPWASSGLLDEGRLEALQRLKLCLLNGDTQLDFSGLGLRVAPAAYPPQVVKLNLSQNRLQTFQSIPLPNLMRLDISHNLFTELPSVPGNKLGVVIAHHNKLKRLPATLSESLAELDVSHNHIHSVELVSHAQLVSLKLNNNLLTSLPNLSQLKLKSLYLDHNRLTEMPNVPNTLTILSLAHNQIKVGTWAIPDKLTFLDLNSNFINIIPQSWQFSRLRHLKLNNNQIEEILDPLPLTLNSFSANDNLIMDFPKIWPPKLTSIMLVNNDITSMSDTVFPPGLRVLNLNQNQIGSLSENLPAGIKRIFIADNKLKTIMANVPRDLELIDVSKNMIKQRPEHLPVEVEFINTP